MRTKRDVAGWYAAKLAMVRRLYALAYSREQVVELYRMLDWLLRMPEDVEVQLHADVVAYEQENSMSYISSAERIGRLLSGDASLNAVRSFIQSKDD